MSDLFHEVSDGQQFPTLLSHKQQLLLHCICRCIPAMKNTSTSSHAVIRVSLAVLQQTWIVTGATSCVVYRETSVERLT